MEGSIALNTPFGSVGLLSGSGTEAALPDGQYLLSLLASTQLFSVGGSLSGIFFFNPAPYVTGLTVDLADLEISFPGTYLGGILPNVSFL